MFPITRSRIHVAIVDDHEMVRMSLSMFLQSYDDIEIVGDAPNAAKAIELCAQTLPDVILMDYLMPEMDGIEAARLLNELYPGIRVILLTATIESDLAQQASAAGVVCFAKKDPSLDLHDVIQMVYEKGDCH